MYFLRRVVPLQVSASRLRGLRLSLNTPVVGTEDLGLGPARGAILVHQEADGRPNVTIGVHSLKTGESVIYGYDGDLREESSVAVGIDAALSFAEGMGFLFDEDELPERPAPEDRVRALGLWSELIGSSAGAPASEDDGQVLDLADELEAEVLALRASARAGPGADVDRTEPLAHERTAPLANDRTAPLVSAPTGPLMSAPTGPLIDHTAPLVEAPGEAPLMELDVIALDEEIDPVLGEASGLELDLAPRSREPGLSKFRAEPEAAVREPPPAGPARPAPARRDRKKALGRVRLVRRSADGGEGRHPLLKLLASF